MAATFKKPPGWSKAPIGWHYYNKRGTFLAHVWEGRDSQWFGWTKDNIVCGPFASDYEARKAMEGKV